MFPAVAFLTIILFAAGTAAAGTPPLLKAAGKGDINKVKELLDKGADINEWKYGLCALIIAAQNGNMEMAKLLIDRGANLDIQAGGGWSPLGQAARAGQGEMVDLLLARGADMDRALAGMQKWIEYKTHGPFPDARIAGQVSQGIMMIQGRAGKAYYQCGQYDKALKRLTLIVEHNPADADSRIGLAFCDCALKRYDEARDEAEAAVKLAPDNFEAHLALADAFLGLGKADQAIGPLNKAVELNPKNPWTYNRLGNACYKLDRYTEAIANFQKTVELAPGETGPLQSLMNACSRIGRLDEAIAAAGKLLEKKEPKDSIEVLSLRSLLYREKGMIDEAAKDAEKAASIDAGQIWSLLSMGASALDRGDYDKAIRLLSSIKEQDFTLAFILESAALAKKGDMKEAEKIFASIGGDPASSVNYLTSKNALAAMDLLKPVVQGHLDKAGSLEGGAGYRDALGEYAAAFKLAVPSTAGGIRARVAGLLKSHADLMELTEEARKYSLRAEVLLEEKKPSEALDEYETALGLAPFSPRLHYAIAILSADLEKPAKAIGHMKDYLDLYPGAPNAREAMDMIYKWEFKIEKEAEKR